MKPINRKVETYFNKWGANMAYVIGYFSADGTMYKNKNGSYYIAFTSTDSKQIILIKKLLGVSNKIEVYQARENWKIRYTLQVGSVKVYNKLTKFGLSPAKSLPLAFPNIPDKFLGHFLRGYFNGDGCAAFDLIKRKDRKNKIYPRLMIRITCGSKNFLQTLNNKLMAVVSLTSGSLFFHSNAYNLAYYTKNVIKLYSFMYPSENVPCLERKQNILKKGIKEMGLKCNGFARFPVTE